MKKILSIILTTIVTLSMFNVVTYADSELNLVDDHFYIEVPGTLNTKMTKVGGSGILASSTLGKLITSDINGDTLNIIVTLRGNLGALKTDVPCTYTEAKEKYEEEYTDITYTNDLNWMDTSEENHSFTNDTGSVFDECWFVSGKGKDHGVEYYIASAGLVAYNNDQTTVVLEIISDEQDTTSILYKILDTAYSEFTEE